MPPPVITLLTDFGLQDGYVAAMKGVILRICPGASLLDISHPPPVSKGVRLSAWSIREARVTGIYNFPPDL